MRFPPESTDGANKGTVLNILWPYIARISLSVRHCCSGLDIARNVLEKVKKQFPEVSYADLW